MGEFRVEKVLVLCVLSLLWGAFATSTYAEDLVVQGTKIFTVVEKFFIHCMKAIHHIFRW
jgi:hypothetical protein